MSALKINTSSSLACANKEKPLEKIQNTSFIHSLKNVKNTVIQSIISTYHKLRFMLKQKFENIEIVENPAYHKKATNLLLPINNQSTDKAYRLYLANIELINQYPDIPNNKKAEFNVMNKAIFNLLNEPTLIKQEGIFRTNGVNSKISELLSIFADHPTLVQQLNTEQRFDQKEFTGVIKALRNKILTDHPKEKDKLDKLISTYKESIDQKNATKEYVANMSPDKRDKILRIAENNADERLPSLQELPLHLQICMPLFVEVAKHSQENKMKPMNIAIAFGGGLHPTKITIAEEKAFNKLNNVQLGEVIKQETAHVNLANELLMKLITKQLK